jgi:hypothetical protein
MNKKDWNRDNKELMVGITVSLSKAEAISFARSLPQCDKYYLVKISENPHARHIAKRERFVVVRYPHNGESVDDGHAMFENSNRLAGINANT